MGIIHEQETWAGGIVKNSIRISATEDLVSNTSFNGNNRGVDSARLTALKLLQS